MSLLQTFPLPNKGETQTDEQKLMSLYDKGDFYCLEFHSPPDNRLTCTFIDAFVEALNWLLLKKSGAPKPLVTTSAIPKFYSNGLDLEAAIRTPQFFQRYLGRMQRALIEFPWPTIAYVNGHAFAGGFILANSHDFKVQNSKKGWLCMNEIEFDAPLIGQLMSIHAHQYGPVLARKITMMGHRFPAAESLKDGLVDAIGGWPEVEEIVQKCKKYAGKNYYNQMRMTIFAPVLDHCINYYDEEARDIARQEAAQQFIDDRQAEIKAKL
ncbi:ClpP/crotonase-like domain-containing protein [Yarrowia lipolytica]|jgi:enoyl-CoA hydratase/carnithine racemase|uniref:YALI0D09493p n=2 Tax=Yarrowia lipolytica TaxID=4952 RepID=Q6C9P1_YARLI|nr:YALI0D09493p [Yarrowia lipolytica CLIB122]AOW03835.1 hypothetical protein YALI1_D12091g [Yarrowia lipolytica]KAB8283104.1 ClpP/crotonase-like domain-containing protein [Yarrowia lipolytica]KAE8170011.1 ClpP/crotonase-like domain-containing protein [Yarrowia lipolytica]KAJ8054587.1 ClpP/crotonase-like domain-containing protein [Yarrowia lipolytica]RDW41406.1 ClpP/crotonase-like domain-containing protein [Yarrowia lipolytica]|eukprot:XP_502621.1 YALI0D09493p [Yarrowia lipolytica CLIB122]